jgi:hypothetical protein
MSRRYRPARGRSTRRAGVDPGVAARRAPGVVDPGVPGVAVRRAPGVVDPGVPGVAARRVPGTVYTPRVPGVAARRAPGTVYTQRVPGAVRPRAARGGDSLTTNRHARIMSAGQRRS